MAAAGLVAATDGNISCRLDNGHFLITPSGVGKGLLTKKHLLVTNADGIRIQGTGRVSTEIKLHLLVYSLRSDIHAIIHAHPPKCIACTIAGLSFDQPILPEVVVTLGRIPTAPYATPSTEALPESIRTLIPHTDAIILDRHGTLTAAATLPDALYKLEKLEHTAGILLNTHMLGTLKTLPDDEVQRLESMRDFYGVRGRHLSFLKQND